jgi:hypothetical protein
MIKIATKPVNIVVIDFLGYFNEKCILKEDDVTEGIDPIMTHAI